MVSAQHLGVAGLPQHAAQLLELVAHRLGDLPVQERPVRREGAAQPARGHAHLVHGVGGVAPHERVAARPARRPARPAGAGRPRRPDCFGSASGSRGPPGSASPSARASLDEVADGVAPAARSTSAAASRRAVSPSTSSTSHSRQCRGAVASPLQVVTRSSATSASTRPRSSSRRWAVRRLRIVTTGSQPLVADDHAQRVSQSLGHRLVGVAQTARGPRSARRRPAA